MQYTNNYRRTAGQKVLNRYYLLLLLLSGILTPYLTVGQTDSTTYDTTGFHQQDFKDWLAKRKSKQPKPAKGNFLLVIPYISSNPTAGFMIGGGLTYTFKTKKTDEHISLISSNASYSTNNLVNVNMKSNVFMFNEKLVLNGDWRFLINSETTYGLGTDVPLLSSVDINGYSTSSDSLGQPLRFNQLRFYEVGSWRLISNFFAGLGFQYDRYYNIKDDKLEKGDTILSYHYQYSIRHGFNPKEYSVSGFSINLLFDSRDNQVNAYRGQFANINYRINLKELGSSDKSTMLLTEYRGFIPLDGLKSRHILGFWLYGKFTPSGNAPYLALPALGYDQQQRTGRGYRYGQFRGQDMLYGETEYRFPISPHTGILGGVAFFNITTTSDRAKEVQLMEFWKPGYGAGLRVMLDKASRTRLSVEVGMSPGSVGFYLAALETF